MLFQPGFGSLLYIALDQGQRLDWLHSGTIVGLIVSGMFLVVMTVVRRVRVPNPLINLKFLLSRNTLLLGRGTDHVSFCHAGDRRGHTQLSGFT